MCHNRILITKSACISMCISGNWSISVPFYPKAGKLLQRRICQLGKQRHFGEGEEGLS